MNICFLCDLHLGYNKNTVQYEAFDYACADISRKRPDLVVYAGDITSDGNIFAAKRFIKKMNSLGVPYVALPGNSDYRTENKYFSLFFLFFLFLRITLNIYIS